MEIEIESKPVKRLVPTDIVFQTPFWAEVKSHLGWEPKAYDFSFSGVDGDILLLERKMRCNRLVLYAPYGPEMIPDDEDRGLFLESLAMELKERQGRSVALVRYDLPWNSPYQPAPSRGEATDFRPESRVREMRMNFQTRTWNLRAAPSDVFAPVTMVIDLRPELDKILAGMKPKTRYNIRLAKRKGVSVRVMSDDFLPAFHRMYVETAIRKRFPVPSFEHLQALIDAGDPGIDDVAVDIWGAFVDDELLAGAIVAYSEGRAYYLHGASRDYGGQFMAPYAVQWSVIKAARSRGCTSYDMFGVSPCGIDNHPLSGVRRFKSGFGGDVVQHEGTWDYPFDEAFYEGFRFKEMLA